MDIPVPSGGKSALPVVLLLLLLVVAVFFALGSLNLAGSTTQTQTGQCPPFDERQEAFRLAQIAEQYRKANPQPVNYSLGSYTVCFTNGKTISGTTRIARGFDANTPTDKYKTHAEQAVYIFLQARLAGLSLDPGKVVVIYAMIFSQVRVCGPCQTSMIPWQAGLRQKARTDNLFLSIWDIGNNGFDPGIYPAGNRTPVTLDALRKVEIPFTP